MRKMKESGERVVGELSTKAMLKQIMLREKIRQIDIRIDKQANSRESQAQETVEVRKMIKMVQLKEAVTKVEYYHRD